MYTIKIIYSTGQEYGFMTSKYNVLNLEEGRTIDTDEERITLSHNDTAYVINENGITISRIEGNFK